MTTDIEWPVMALLTDQWRRKHGLPVRMPQSLYIDGNLYEATLTGNEFTIEVSVDDAKSKEMDAERNRIEREMAPIIRQVKSAAEAVTTDPNPRNKKRYEDLKAQVESMRVRLSELGERGKNQVHTWPVSVFDMKGL
jgi:hypothetical protein